MSEHPTCGSVSVYALQDGRVVLEVTAEAEDATMHVPMTPATARALGQVLRETADEAELTQEKGKGQA